MTTTDKPKDIGALGRSILIVDDDSDNSTLLSRLMEHSGHRTAVATDVPSARAVLASGYSPQLVLLDINMPGPSGLDFLAELRQKAEYVPVILVSAQTRKDDVIHGLDAGADDYICKPFEPAELLARARAQLRLKDLQEELAVANARLKELVDIDDLTGLYNMRSIYDRLETEIVRSRRYGRTLSVIMMDLDNFKHVNDNNDHLFGSFVLSEIGRLVKAEIRDVDFAARYGGDEFLIGLPESSVGGATRFAERMRKMIESHTFSKDQSSIQLTASFGVCVASPGLLEIDARAIVRFADRALYEAKDVGKNCVRLYDPGRVFHA